MNLIIQLHLRLRAGGANDNAVAVFSFKTEHIGAFLGTGGNRSALQIAALHAEIVAHIAHLLAGNLQRRILTHFLHKCCAARRTVDAFHIEIVHAVGKNAVAAEHLVPCIQKRHALAVIIGCHFANEQGGDHGILILCITSAQVSVAFLEAEQKPVAAAALLRFNGLGNIFEAGIGRMERNTVFFADTVGQGGGNDALHGICAARKSTLAAQSADDVIQQQAAHLIARDGFKCTVFPARHHADAVRIGVGCNHQVGPDLFGKRNTKGKGFWIFGVGEGDCRKIAVRFALL